MLAMTGLGSTTDARIVFARVAAVGAKALRRRRLERDRGFFDGLGPVGDRWSPPCSESRNSQGGGQPVRAAAFLDFWSALISANGSQQERPGSTCDRRPSGS